MMMAMSPHTRTGLPAGAGRCPVTVLGIILAAGVCLEIVVRGAGYQVPRWYPRVAADNAWQSASRRMVFVGTSRTFASIDEDLVASALDARVINLGQGFSTMAGHALGLRYLAERGALTGATVVIEAPGGLPDPATWHDPWFSPERPQWLLSVMRPGDLPSLWRSTSPVEDLMTASFRSLAVGSQVAAYREDVRVRALDWIYDRARGRTSQESEREAEVAEDIVLPARRNPADRERIRQAAVLDGERWLVGLRDVDWRSAIVSSMVETVRQAGGRVVLLSVPLSHAMSRGLMTPVADANRRRLTEAERQWGVIRVEVPVEFSDDDFPDLWHLSARGRERFTAGFIALWRAGSYDAGRTP